MQIYPMDSVLTKINQIKNLKSISIYYLNNNIPALLIFYGNMECLNLCSKDKYFRQYVSKVREVYLMEKKDYSNDLDELNEKIDIDEETKDILISGKFGFLINEYSYSDADEFKSSLLFQIDKIKPLLNILKFHLKHFFENTDYSINFGDKINGYKNNYRMSCQLNGNLKDIFINYSEINSKYIFTINGIFEAGKSLIMEINFKNNGIFISLKQVDLGLYVKYEYFFKNDKLIMKTEYSKNSGLIYFKETEILPTSVESNKIGKSKKTFLLPWNSKYISIMEVGTTIRQKVIYLDENDNYLFQVVKSCDFFMKDDHYLPLLLDEINKTVYGIPLNENKDIWIYEKQISSYRLSNGNFSDCMVNSYYYRLVKLNTFGKIVVPLKKDNISDKTDLLDENYIKKLVGGTRYGR